ncbi:phosphatase PAP2 family protein [Endozoicomonas elysicola]|uniref:undecaprenyl-diphosphate phosphatase n=1 Tax=Endozoicomonas elysicola TaxID=305900 RepID=A0A081KFL4_9GAMM|nr:phosphatase PAP2 family protein [Endozoicomonas elysicola]KEI72940.1 hypothetical protein GV64_21410 [Endozoicomonas elysicola]
MLDPAQLIAETQAILAPMDTWFRWLSTTGYSGGYLFICAVLYWSGYTVLGARLACTTLFSTLIFGGCRQLFNSPRPYFEHPELFNNWEENRWGMPSGHSQNAVVFWGWAFLSIRSTLFRLIALILIALIMLSRLYLGVHYPSQIFVGLLIGLAIIIISYHYETRFLQWLMSLQTRLQVTSILFITSSPWLLTLVTHELLSIGPGNGSTLPYQKLSFYTGLLLGTATATLVANTHTRITQLSPSWKLIGTRTIPGMLTVLVIWPIRLELPLDVNHHFAAYLLLWLQGIGISLWVCLIWPLLHYHLLGQRYQKNGQEPA